MNQENIVHVSKDFIGKSPYEAIKDLVARGYKVWVYWRDGAVACGHHLHWFNGPNEIALFVINDKVVHAVENYEHGRIPIESLQKSS